MNPKYYIARIVFFGLVGGAAALQMALPGVTLDDLIQSLCAAVIASGAYAGLGYATPLEPTVGRKSD